MADNVTFQKRKLATPPVDTVVAGDDIGGAIYQRVNIFSKTGDSTFQSPRIDYPTHVLMGIDYVHHEIHVGSNYEIVNYVDLAINNVFDIRITTPNTTKWAHFFYNFETKSETLWYLYRNAVISTAGTAVTPINSNHNSSNTSALVFNTIANATLVLADADTDVSGASTIWTGISGDGKEGGEKDHEHEIILKQNTIYDIRFIATAAGYVNYHLNWYEHTDKSA